MLPVADDVRHPLASPRAAVDYLVHAATLDTALLGDRRALTMPGLSVTVAEQIEALRELAGDAAVALIRREHDAIIARIVAGWPRAFDAERAPRSASAPRPRSPRSSPCTCRTSSAAGAGRPRDPRRRGHRRAAAASAARPRWRWPATG